MVEDKLFPLLWTLLGKPASYIASPSWPLQSVGSAIAEGFSMSLKYEDFVLIHVKFLDFGA